VIPRIPRAMQRSVWPAAGHVIRRTRPAAPSCQVVQFQSSYALPGNASLPTGNPACLDATASGLLGLPDEPDAASGA
jgi:hypothetical protein